MSTSQLSPGTVVDGRFTVGAVLRTRVGATTYEATDSEGQSVALTIYDEACFPSSLVLERSLRELRQLQGAASPRVLSVLAAGRHGDGLFEATPVPPERSLGQFLQAGPLALRDAAGILVQVGEALLEGQRLGVTHRNLGADVVFPSPQGVKVTGFAVGEPHGEVSHGPLPTMAPEQVEGKVVDQRTLIYNLAALMHWMLRGEPLFSGSPEDVLHHHVATEPGDDVHTALRRALGKDARLRPMMLKPFLVDIAEVAGVDPPREVEAEPHASESPATPADAVTPSSRGWTMFMAAAEDDVSKAEAEAKKPAAPAPPAAAEVKPSTRGWTMFMNADEDEDDDDDASSAVKPASESKPAAAPEPDPEDEAKPSTRGWTMFMTTEEAEEPEASPAKQESSTPAEEAKPSGAAASTEVKPSTRGWTMFMNADEDEDEDEEAPVPATPAEAPSSAATSPAPVSPEPTPAASAPVPATPPADEAKPSTRGWTMFMTAEEGDDEDDGKDEPVKEPAPAAAPKPASSAPVAPAAPSVPSASAPATPAVSSAPREDAPVAHTASESGSAAAGSKSRGWTIFMEPAKEPATKDGPVAPTVTPAPAKAKAPEPTAPAAAPERAAPVVSQRPVPGSAAANPGQKKRGWTMFMNAPIPELKKPGTSGTPAGSPGAAPLGSQPLVQTPKPGPAAATGSPAAGPGTGESDTRGWTVFGAPAPMRTPAAPPLTPPPGIKPIQRPASDAVRNEVPSSTRPASEPRATPNREASAPQTQAAAPGPIPAGLSNMPTTRTVPGGGEALAELTDRQGNDLAKPAAKRTGWVLAGAVIGIGVIASIVAWLLG